MKYEHQLIDKKWQDRWDEAKLFEASEDHSKKKCDFFHFWRIAQKGISKTAL